ncbi:hypothetical protein [Arcobacter sp. CECT 8985]|uniref:hypothetical protein n=1 Tax=Arcobacter sp. CECT 8985 TaxID=1935424 RepID=UPI00100B2F4A|nr:hypothetical protein [Arcobacter sp. CECT 8985]RXJ86977.1 hypothetical protein CRU93_06230 [Arcobacter sp. CECT 8985]
MSQIKEELLEVVNTTMIPEVESYIQDLHKLMEDGDKSEDTMDESREMEDFLVELQNIVLAIKENKMSDDQAQDIYDRIEAMLEEHSAHEGNIEE